MAKKYYTVWKGNSTGVFDSWEECKQAVSGCSAIYKSFPTLEQAEAAFNDDFSKYVGAKKEDKIDFFDLKMVNRPIIPSISVDAACSGNPGVLEFRGVETATGAEIFRRGPFVDGTQNIGEFLAIAFALAILKKGDVKLPIYSDSLTAMNWIKNKKCNTKHPVSEKNKDLFFILQKAENWLKNNDYPNEIIKWDTANWGEIPADFGRK